jgi:predicted dehydrogenase
VAQLDGGYADAVVIGRAGAIEADSVEHRRLNGELPLLAELRAFVEHLEGGPPPLSSAADAVAIVAAVEEMIALARASEVAGA